MKPRTLLQGLAGLAAWGCLSGLALVRLWAVLYGRVPGPAILAAAAALEETWKAETGAAVDAANARTMQPAIIKWNANIRKSMPLEAEALAKSALKEVLFAAADGKVYFYDLDNGAEIRIPPLSPMMQTLIDKGGMVNYVKEQLKLRGEAE